MGFEPDPSGACARDSRGESRPSSSGINDSPALEPASRGHYAKNAVALKFGYSDLLDGFNAGALCFPEQRMIELEASDATSRRRNGQRYRSCIRNDASVVNKWRRGELAGADEGCKQVEGFGGDELATDLVAGKFVFFQQQYACAGTRGGNGTRASSGTGTGHNQVVSWGFQAMTPMRNR